MKDAHAVQGGEDLQDVVLHDVLIFLEILMKLHLIAMLKSS